MSELTIETVRARPTLSVPDTAAFMGISDDLAYQAIKAGELPSLHFGRKILVPTAPLLKILGLETTVSSDAEATNSVNDTGVAHESE